MSMNIKENLNKNLIKTNFALQLTRQQMLVVKHKLIGFIRFVHDNK